MAICALWLVLVWLLFVSVLDPDGGEPTGIRHGGARAPAGAVSLDAPATGTYQGATRTSRGTSVWSGSSGAVSARPTP